MHIADENKALIWCYCNTKHSFLCYWYTNLL